MLWLQRRRRLQSGQQRVLQQVPGFPLGPARVSGLTLNRLLTLHRPLRTFVQTWLDEYSDDLRDPPQHPALRLLLDHLAISGANFCSLAGRAEELLGRFRTEGDALELQD